MRSNMRFIQLGTMFEYVPGLGWEIGCLEILAGRGDIIRKVDYAVY